MKTSKEWWAETKSDPNKLNKWLQRQCYGEFQAYKRIFALSERFKNETLIIIAEQELKHYAWIKNYLEENNIPTISEHEERYWKEIGLDFDNLEQAAAVGHHAETMRLGRIRVIAEDSEFPVLQMIFKKILVEEEFHAQAFKELSNEESIEIAKIDHEVGMIQLGLIA